MSNGNADIKIVRCILTLYSDSQFQNPIKSKIYTDLTPDETTLKAFIVYCGLSPNTTYYYSVEIVRSYKFRFTTYEFSVVSYGKFTTGLNGDTVVDLKPVWEEEGCIVYGVTVMWDFVMSQIMLPDVECSMDWYYAFNDGDFVQVPSSAISHRTIIISEEVEPNEGAESSNGDTGHIQERTYVEHVEIHFDGLSGDKKFTVKGILTKDTKPNDDYGLVYDELFWKDLNNVEG